MKDSSGNWITLISTDRRELTDSELTENSGTPRKYDKLGSSLILTPAPSYSSTNGLEVQFQRGASYFVPSDTTKSPGFASHLHRLISLYAARDYCLVNEKSKRVAVINIEIKSLEAELVEFYSSRFRDSKVSMRAEREDYGQSTLDHGGSPTSESSFNI